MKMIYKDVQTNEENKALWLMFLFALVLLIAFLFFIRPNNTTIIQPQPKVEVTVMPTNSPSETPSASPTIPLPTSKEK